MGLCIPTEKNTFSEQYLEAGSNLQADDVLYRIAGHTHSYCQAISTIVNMIKGKQEVKDNLPLFH